MYYQISSMSLIVHAGILLNVYEDTISDISELITEVFGKATGLSPQIVSTQQPNTKISIHRISTFSSLTNKYFSNLFSNVLIIYVLRN